MEIKDLQPRMGKVEMVVTVKDIAEPREFEKFGKTGKVANAMVCDETGTIKMSLWNEQIDQIKVGDKLLIKNGYVSEWQGEMQLGTGKFGSLEIVDKALPEEKAEEEVVEEKPKESPVEEKKEEMPEEEDIVY